MVAAGKIEGFPIVAAEGEVGRRRSAVRDAAELLAIRVHDPEPAGAAAIAAGEQGHGWNFIELFYRNQGSEDSGYADDKFLTAIAKGAGVPNIAKWNADRKSSRVLGQVEASTAQAEQLGFSGTPSFAVEGPGTSGLETIDTTVADPTAALESAISAAR